MQLEREKTRAFWIQKQARLQANKQNAQLIIPRDHSVALTASHACKTHDTPNEP